MDGSDERDAARRRRQQLIERLNEKEAELARVRRTDGSQMSEEEFKAEIEKERQRNFSRRGFPQMF